MILHKFKQKIFFLLLALSSQFIFASAEITPSCKWLLDMGVLNRKFPDGREVGAKFYRDFPQVTRLTDDSFLANSEKSFDNLDFIQGFRVGSPTGVENDHDVTYSILANIKNINSIVYEIAKLSMTIRISEGANNTAAHMYVPRPILSFSNIKTLKSSSSPMLNSLFLPASMLLKKNLTFEERFVLLHEFAHLLFYSNLFNKNLLETDNVYNPFDELGLCQDSLAQYEKISSSSTNMYTACSILTNLISSGHNPDHHLRDIIFNELKRSEKAFDDRVSINIEKRIVEGMDLSHFFNKHIKYAEVYSDFAASVMLGSPKACVKVFQDNPKHQLLRCFDVNFEEVFSPYNQSVLDIMYDNNDHLKLYRERYTLYQHFYGKLGKEPGGDIVYDGWVLREAFKILAKSAYKEVGGSLGEKNN
jgi:hypothetical protein